MKREGYWLLAIIVLVALAVWANISCKPHYGLDINGGVRAVLQADVPPSMHNYDQNAVMRILEDRLNSSGVAEPTIQPKGQYQFIVELPTTAQNKDAIIQQLKSTAQLEFRWFRNVQFGSSGSAVTTRYIGSVGQDAQGHEADTFVDKQTNRTFGDQASILQKFQTLVSDSKARPGAAAFTVPAPLSQFASADQTPYFTPDQAKEAQDLNQQLQDFDQLISDDQSPLIMSGNDIQSNAHAAFDPTTSQPVVDLTCTPQGTNKWGSFTLRHNQQSDPTGDNLTAIILDGHILSVPVVNTPIMDGNTQISGAFTNLTEAQNLANLLNAGALPVPLSIVESQSVEATLGNAAIHKMIIAGIIGLSAVLVFMAAYYLLPGLVADIALLIYTLFALAIFKAGIPGFTHDNPFIPAITLTLPGIAGFILSVGMAVDANILIFERLKEELRNGKPLRQAIDDGFKRAFTAIRDSNACTLITCAILGFVGTKEVQGFAITLAIGVCLSLFTAITVTRTLLYLLVDAGAGKNLSLFGIKRQWVYAGVREEGGEAKPPLNVIHNRKYFYGLSLLVIVPGIVFWTMGGLKYSFEFTGGTQVEAVFRAPVSQEAVQRALTAAGYKDNLVQMAEGGTIAFTSVKDRADNAYLGVEQALNHVGTPYQLQSHSLVGGVISKELTAKAFDAVICAAVLIVLYLAIAFSLGGFVAGLRFGTSAIVALLHDVLVLIGSFAILGYFLSWQIDSMFIVATLTVVGFSVHDTIVIFDRLRENLRRRLRGESFEALANRSILQSFARSINTSFTVILTLTAMMIFGEPSTRLLIAALLIGVVSGTYSSIFNATPILVDWENWLAQRRTQAPSTSGRPTPAPAVPAGVGSGHLVKAIRENGATPAAEGQEPAAPASSDTPAASRVRGKKKQRRF